MLSNKSLPQELPEKTFLYQNSLPNLPLPTLRQTLEKYLDSVRPHVSEEEFLHTKNLVLKFEVSDGYELQKRLLKNTTHQRNWLEKWWEDIAYLKNRTPSIPSSNFAGPLISESTLPCEGSQVKRAALHLNYIIEFWKTIKQETLHVQKSNNNAWCMNQFHRLFNTCKLPGDEQDKLEYYFKTDSQGWSPTHITVQCRGYFFTFDVLDECGNLLGIPEYEILLHKIREECDKRPYGAGIGALTSDDRTSWSQSRKYLIKHHPTHEHNLHVIETSLFSLVLDEYSPYDLTQVAFEGLCGDIKNRWADKSMCIIIFKNGTLAINCDHAPFDAMAMLGMQVYLEQEVNKKEGNLKANAVVRPLSTPKELVFYTDNVILDSIDAVLKSCHKLTNNLDLKLKIFNGYGKAFTKEYKLHPDYYIQLSLQLAYYRLYNRPAPTYETATTRQFYHGRTETVRSCTPEAVAWCQAMLDNNQNNDTKKQLLVTAHAKHQKWMKDAMQNHGCDRHLLGLYITALEENFPLPEIFLDPSFTKSGGGGNFILSTSCTGYAEIFGAVAPMCENGYGCFYSIRDEKILFGMTSWKTMEKIDIDHFYQMIETSLIEMKNLLSMSKL